MNITAYDVLNAALENKSTREIQSMLHQMSTAELLALSDMIQDRRERGETIPKGLEL